MLGFLVKIYLWIERNKKKTLLKISSIIFQMCTISKINKFFSSEGYQKKIKTIPEKILVLFTDIFTWIYF